MPSRKTALLNLRVEPGIKEALRIAAKREHRSIVNLIEVLVRQHCEKVGIMIPDQGTLFGEDRDERENAEGPD